MWEWLADNQAVAWLAAALILIGVDMMIGMDVWLIMFGFGALVGAGAVVLGVGTPVALAIAAVVSLLLLFLVRPPILKKLHAGADLKREEVKDLVGRHARAIGAIDDDHGQIKLDGVVWTARPYMEDSRIPAGTAVEVLTIDELTVMVHPIDESLVDLPAEVDWLADQHSPESATNAQAGVARPQHDTGRIDEDARQSDNPKEA